MIEVLREFRQAAQREIEIAENKLQHIRWEDDPSAYDYWTWVLLTAQRKHRRAVVFAKRVEREERLYTEIRGNSSPIQRPEPAVFGEASGYIQGKIRQEQEMSVYGNDCPSGRCER